MKNCYCGHPESSHENGRYGKNCWHCDCKRFAESQEPKALEEKDCTCSVPDADDCGRNRATGKCPCRCHAYRWVKVPELALRKLAKPQEASEEKCCRCENGIEYWPGFSRACTCKCHAKPQDKPKEVLTKKDIDEQLGELLYEPCHQESETDEKKFLKYLHIEPPAIIEGGHSYYVKDEILKAFRQFLKSLEK